MAVNEALRQADEANAQIMGKLAGGLGGFRRPEHLMDYYGSHINRLIEELQGLPGIGAKTAQRLAFHIINMPKEQVRSMADAMVDAREHANYCRECFTITDEELCPHMPEPEEGPQTDHGGGKPQGSGGL